MSRIRSAVVGLGQIGPTHTEAVSALDNTVLTAVCDINRELADRFAEKYGCAAVYDFDELIKRDDVDLVHICLPSGMHAEFGIKAARAGKHVLVEKPIDITLEAADALIAACKEAGVVLSCISQHRFDPDIEALKRAADEGRLGTLNFGGSHTKWWRSQDYYDSGDWRGTWALDGGGALMNQSVHYVDMLQYMMGEVEEVFAYAATRAHVRIEVEDVVTAAVKFKSGAIGLLEGNTTAYPGFCTRLDIYGDKGGVVIENDVIREWKVEGDAPVSAKPNAQTGAGSAAIASNSHQRQIRDVADAILNGRAPRITGEDARAPLAIVLAVYESVRKGKAVRPG